MLNLFNQSIQTLDMEYTQDLFCKSSLFRLNNSFSFSSRLDIPAAEVKAVYRTAMQLKIPSVAKACSSYLAMNLTPTNCLGIITLPNVW